MAAINGEKINHFSAVKFFGSRNTSSMLRLGGISQTGLSFDVLHPQRDNMSVISPDFHTQNFGSDTRWKGSHDKTRLHFLKEMA
jgi:hypothetical protein